MTRLKYNETFRLGFLCGVFLLLVSLAPKQASGVGFKQRIAEARDAAGDSTPEPRETAPKLEHSTKLGHKQRKLQHDSELDRCPETAASSTSGLVKELSTDWAKGKLTTEQVQRYAMRATEDGAEGVEHFAKMGAWGKHTQSLSRAMRNALGHPRGAPELSYFEIPMLDGTNVAHPFLLPHEFFSSYYSQCGLAQFRKHLAGPIGACRNFWNCIKESPFVVEHENLAPATWPSTVPLGFHADAGAFTKQDSVYVFSWNSLVGRGTTHQKRFVFTVARKGSMTDGSLDAILKVFAWSMNSLLAGETPTVGPLGGRGGGWRCSPSWRLARRALPGSGGLAVLQGMLPVPPVE
jgi:hypothetical protein